MAGGEGGGGTATMGAITRVTEYPAAGNPGAERGGGGARRGRQLLAEQSMLISLMGKVLAAIVPSAF